MTTPFAEHVENIIEIDDQCFSAYFSHFNSINTYLEKENNKKSKLSIFLDQKFDLNKRKLVSNLDKNANKFMKSFFNRQSYFYNMNWGYDGKKEMFDVYDHVSRKLKLENKNEPKTLRNFDTNKQFLKSILIFEERKEIIATLPSNTQDQHSFQLELSFTSQVAQYNHIRETSYSTQNFKLS